MSIKVYSRRATLMGWKPYDAEVAWVGLTPQAYVNTGYVPTGSDIVIETKILVKSYADSNQYTPWFFTYVNQTTATYRVIRRNGTNDTVFVNCGDIADDSYNAPCVIPSLNYIRLSAGQIQMNGRTTTIKSPSSTVNTANMRIGSSSIYENVYYFRIIKGGKVVLDLIPVRKDGVGYLYDKVSKRMIASIGSAGLSYGPDKGTYLPSSYRRVEYVQNTTNAYIDTPYVISDSNDAIRGKFNLQSIPVAYGGWFGHYLSANSLCTRLIVNNTSTTSVLVYWKSKGNTASVAVSVNGVNQDNEFSLEASKITMNGVDTTVPAPASGDYECFTTQILAARQDLYVRAKCYYFEIGDKVSLVPCISPSNVVGLYDIINHIFLPPARGTLVAGGEV